MIFGVLLGVIIGAAGLVFVLRNNPTLLAKLITDSANLEALYARVKNKISK